MWNDPDVPDYDVFEDDILSKWRSRPKIKMIHHQTGALKAQHEKNVKENPDYVMRMLIEPRSQSVQQSRRILRTADRNPTSPALDLVHVEPVMLRKRIECAQIGCYNQANTMCDCCGFLCKKCDTYYHRASSRVAAFKQKHYRRPLALARLGAHLRATPAPATSPTQQPRAASCTLESASSRKAQEPQDEMDEFMPADVREAKAQLQHGKRTKLSARRVQGTYVLPYCKMLRNEALSKRVQHWERTKKILLSGFAPGMSPGSSGAATPEGGRAQAPQAAEEGNRACQAPPSSAGTSVYQDEDGSLALSKGQEADVDMLPGLEKAVPIRLCTPHQTEGQEESVVWFPRGPDSECELDAGMNQLLAEAREGESRGEDYGQGL